MNPYEELNRAKRHLTQQEYRTIKGQIRAGDVTGAMKGLERLKDRGVRNRGRNREEKAKADSNR